MTKTSKSAPTQIQSDYERLVGEIREHDQAYYTLDAPRISDAEYDRLYRKLKALEAEYPELITPESPTQRVGGEVLEKFAKVKHPEKMLSIDNCLSLDELNDFLKRVTDHLGHQPKGFSLEPKIDGLSLELTYQKRTLTSAATRGDGEVGEEVVHNIKTIRAIPLSLPASAPAQLVVRGEVYIEKKELALINRERELTGEPLFKNCRNAAAGSVRLLDSSISAKRPLKFLAWGVVVQGGKQSIALPGGHFEMLGILKTWGIPIAPEAKLVQRATELASHIKAFESERHQLSYAVDGLVIKINDFAEQASLGFTSKYPRFAVAYKYATEKAVTQVNDIIVQVGRTGTLTPVAEFAPIEVSGSVVARASLHNEEEIGRKDIRIGDWVEIEKAGEVIPQVVRVLTDRRPANTKKFKMPNRCPICSGPVVQDEDEVAKRCGNDACPAKFRESLLFFASRDAMNIERLGPALVEQLVENKLVEDLADLYRLKETEIAQLPRLAEKSAANVMAAIAQSRNQATFTDFITGLGISHVGRVAAGKLAKHFKNIDGMLAANTAQLPSELENLSGIGPVMAAAIIAFLKDSKNRQLLKKFLKLGIDPKLPTSPTTSSNLRFHGLSFCITGTLSRPRDDFRKEIERLGGEWHTSVTKATSYLIAGDGEQGRKLEQAKKYGTKVVTESDYLQLIA